MFFLFVFLLICVKWMRAAHHRGKISLSSIPSMVFWDEEEEGGERRVGAAVNHQSLGLNLITPIVYGGELKWDLQELNVLGSYIMSSV